jgi:hypothetical protein
MGDALLFWSMRPDGSLDPTSLHGEILISRCDGISSYFQVLFHHTMTIIQL